MKPQSKKSALYGIISLGAAVGFIASFLQMLEKLTLLKNAGSNLICSLNSVFNCTNILNAHQSSLFGFPNSLLCLSFFALTLSAGVIGWTGSRLNLKLRLAYQAMALFFAGFGLWYFWQSIFVIGSLCIYCILCYGGVLAINGAWFRLNYAELPWRKNQLRILDSVVANGIDIYFWLLIGLAITVMAIMKFG